MKGGNGVNQNNKRISRFGMLLIIFTALAALISVSVFAAYLRNTNEVKNTFKPADSVVPEIVEEFDGSVKEDVYFKVGDTDYPVYVRAAIVITWQNKDGIVYFSKPDPDSDYSIDLNLNDWELRTDGFYYYKSSVASGGSTSILINSCTQTNDAPVDGYTLSVEILVQTVQAVGSTDGENGTPETDAWKDAWNIS